MQAHSLICRHGGTARDALMKYATIATAALAITGVASAQDSISIEPGEWSFENTMSGVVDMGGGQTFGMPSRTFGDTECIKPEDATLTPERMIREMQEDGGGECQYSDISINGLTMTTSIICVQEGMEMVGDYTYTVTADRRSGTGSMEMNGTMDGMTINSRFSMVGSYIGPCNG